MEFMDAKRAQKKAYLFRLGLGLSVLNELTETSPEKKVVPVILEREKKREQY